MKDLKLKFKFIDRAGRAVYEIIEPGTQPDPKKPPKDKGIGSLRVDLKGDMHMLEIVRKP